MAVAKAKRRLRGKQSKLNTREAQLVALWRAGNHTALELAEMFDVARFAVYRPSSEQVDRGLHLVTPLQRCAS